MQDKNYFVMLHTQFGNDYTPMMDDDEIAKFATKDEAIASARGSPLGSNFGFEVFARGDACHFG